MSEQIDVAQDQVGLGDDTDLEPVMVGQLFQNSARNLEAFLRRLIGIGRSADGDLLAAFYRLNSCRSSLAVCCLT